MSYAEKKLRRNYRDALDGMADGGMIDQAIVIEDYVLSLIHKLYIAKQELKEVQGEVTNAVTITLPAAPNSLEEGHSIDSSIVIREHIQDSVQALTEMTPRRKRVRKSKSRREAEKRRAAQNGN